MDKRLMLGIVALLGFSTACSTVKNSSKEGKKAPKDADSTIVWGNTPSDAPVVKVMYGVVFPKADTTSKIRMQKVAGGDSVTPVVEKADDKDDPQSANPSQPAVK